MSVQPDLRSWQKAIWITLIALLLRLELQAISKDRQESALAALAAQARQEQHFGEIRSQENKELDRTAERIKVSAAQFQETMTKNDQIIRSASHIVRLARENINAATGGDSYAVVWPGEFANDTMSFTIVHKGTYPLHSLRLNISDSAEFERISQSVPLPSLSQLQALQKVEAIGDLPNIASFLQTRMPFDPRKDQIDYHIIFFALNGTWDELLQFRKVNGGWQWAARIKRPSPHGAKVLEEDIQPNYPRENGKIAWRY